MNKITRHLMLIGFIGAVWIRAGAADVPASPTATVAGYLREGDQLYSQRTELQANQKALDLYQKALAADPANINALWRASRAAWWVGTQLTERSERLQTFKLGMQYGEDALKRDPNSVEAHFWLGGNYGSYGHTKGAFTSLFLIHSIRREMEDVRRLDARYMAGGADRILGIMDYKIPAFVGGDKKRALRHLEYALSVDGQNPVTVYYLADYYAALGDKEKAETYLKQLSALSPTPDWAPEMPLMLKQGKELSEKLHA